MELVPTNCSVPGGARELTKSEVLRWLRDHHYTEALKALEATDEAARTADAPAAEQLSDDERTDTSLSVEAELGCSVEEALSAYQQLAGDGGVYALLDHWNPLFLDTYCARKAEGGSGQERCEVEKRMVELQESHNRLRLRERELDTQLKQTVTIIAERLQALATSIDPMRKDILLPLLRTVAMFGSFSSVRTAARHMILTLYKRPIVEHRLAIVQEWLRIARDVPARSLEQELIPELYSLVNAPVFERRLLALDCAAAVAPLLRQSPQVRYSLCQGLLRPLCEDDTAAVRRELPRCLSLLWGDARLEGSASGQAAGDCNGGSVHGGVAKASADAATATGSVPSASASSSAAAATTTATASLAPSQQAFVMELLVHLATDSNSRSVRQAAQTQLCEVLYPVFLQDGVLLTQFVPLLLTVISMEASQMLLQGKPNVRGGSGSGGVAGTTASTAAASTGVNSNSGGFVAKESRRSAADETTAAVASALSLSNVVTLVQLLHAALRCVAAEVVHSREDEERRGEDGTQSIAAAGAAFTTTSVAASLASTYVHVVLPTAHNLLAPLLSKMCNTPALGKDGGAGDSRGAQDPSSQLCGALCALCAALASLVPLLGASAWDGVTCFLKASVLAAPASQTNATAWERDAPPSLAVAPSHDTSQNPQEFLRGRLLFAYAYFLLLSGDVAMLPGHTEQGRNPERALGGVVASVAAVTTTTTTATSTSSPNNADASTAADQARWNADDKIVTPQFPVTAQRIQRESLDFLAQQIRLESDILASPRSTALATCVHCIASLAPFAQESHEVASGVTALIRFLVAAAEPRLRLTAVVLVHDACVAIANERLKVTLLIEPLLPLLEDLQPLVQEAALTGILSVAIALTEPRAQEKTIRPILRMTDTTGCTSRFTRCVLVQWDQLMQRMPAEPREALLYPQLAALMDQLAEQYVERVSREGMLAPPPPRESSDSSVEQWENTMLILQALLHNILRCAVVTPTLVSRYLLPGVQQLASEGVLRECSSNVRTRWHRLLKSYLAFTENNSSRFSPFAGNSSAGNLLDRVKDELKRRL